MEVFDEVLEKAAAGSSQLLTLEGESGSGKSRLLTEVAYRATKLGFRVHRGIGRKDVAQHPFQIFDGVIQGFVSLAKADPDYASHVKSALGQDIDTVTASIPDLQEIFPTSTTHEFVPEVMGEMRTIRALSSYLHALGTGTAPTLIILDDCQWADELTFKLIRHWQNQVAFCQSHVVLVVCFRSEEEAAERIKREIESANHLQLSMLPPDDVRKLAESMGGRLPEEAIDLVIELGGGSPFMSASVLHGLVESEALVFEEKQWRIDPLAIRAIHSANRETKFLTRRLELLSESILRFLTVGAVIGKEFNAQMAAVLSGLDVELAMSAMDTARKRQLIWCRPDGLTCVFMHDQIRRALVERLSEEELKNYHLSAAKYYQGQPANRTAELAYHFDAAGASEFAFPYALEAAELAHHRYALETAQQQYEIARRGIAHLGNELQFRVAGGLGEVLMLRGKYEEAGELFEEASCLATNYHAKAQIGGKLAELSFKRGDMEHSVVDYEKALRVLHCWIPTQKWILALWLIWELLVQVFHTFLPKLFVHRRKTMPNESQKLKIRLFSGLAHGNWYCRGALSTLWAHFRGLNLAEVYVPTSELGNAYSEHAPVMSLLGLFDRAVRYAEKSLTIRRELGDLWGQGQALHYYGCV
ncbi:MAG: AAA family ATPase, partial [Planctomycetaceae bacterium]|nr:AAA family ATPase [Planctomycetaceae bacterium]